MPAGAGFSWAPAAREQMSNHRQMPHAGDIPQPHPTQLYREHMYRMPMSFGTRCFKEECNADQYDLIYSGLIRIREAILVALRVRRLISLRKHAGSSRYRA